MHLLNYNSDALSIIHSQCVFDFRFGALKGKCVSMCVYVIASPEEPTWSQNFPTFDIILVVGYTAMSIRHRHLV